MVQSNVCCSVLQQSKMESNKTFINLADMYENCMPVYIGISLLPC